MSHSEEIYHPKNHIRVVTATSLFDGHDAAINIMRRILQDTGAEVIHLGHNRSVKEIVNTAVEEDTQGIAVSSYQGGHIEFFKYMVDMLKEKGASHIMIFGGGGGVILPDEIKELEAYGVKKIYSPEDGASMGLQGMINHMMSILDVSPIDSENVDMDLLNTENRSLLANVISMLEQSRLQDGYSSTININVLRQQIEEKAVQQSIPVIGITGTGGAGKSSLTDELIFRFLHEFKDLSIAVLSCDPSKRKTGGALLGDRIRMNSISNPRIYMRSLATRNSKTEIPESLGDAINVVKAAGFDLVIVETAGIGQGDSAIIDLVDLPVYVMTSEFGAASQLEKIDMLDFAELVVVNKFEKRGGDDAVRDVRKQLQRNLKLWDEKLEEMQVYGTIASKFNDDGVTAFFHGVLEGIERKTGISLTPDSPKPTQKTSSSKTIIIPPERTRYLAEIAETVRNYHKKTEEQTQAVRHAWHLKEAQTTIKNQTIPEMVDHFKTAIVKAEANIDPETNTILSQWESIKESYSGDELVYSVRDKDVRAPLYFESLSRTQIPKIILPKFEDPGEIYRWMRVENLPGYYPYTAGIFPLKHVGEDPTRMFAGEGDPARTNRRFRLLSDNYEAKRLSTAFDAVTLFGFDPDERPDIYGKVGTSGVSVCTLDDVKVLYGGFDLCDPSTSVSMTINGPAPIILAMFMNTVIDQEMDRFVRENNRPPTEEEHVDIQTNVLQNVRGTVQADILKEDQGQNSCIFSIDFALKMMGDIQEYFIEEKVRNFYSVSISGYHIAEAGANPITQLALTLANGFTYVEYYLSREMPIDSFAPNLSFFFSNGMDPEYTVIGRVARRIWAIAMKERYRASARSQMLKYHIQTSGRSLQAQDIQFNDIRTTLQALCAIYDSCNSLHTNSFDEAITTPGSESVRRALAIQLIINHEWGLARNENMNQGSFIVEELTHLVEEAVLMEFERISTRGGVLGSMETGYQRSKIQEESLYYETLKHTGDLPIVGVNTFRNPDADLESAAECIELSRATEAEKDSQLKRLREFQQRHIGQSSTALKRLQNVALNGGNIFEELMQTVRYCSLGQITDALNDVGGQYRRNM